MCSIIVCKWCIVTEVLVLTFAILRVGVYCGFTWHIYMHVHIQLYLIL